MQIGRPELVSDPDGGGVAVTCEFPANGRKARVTYRINTALDGVGVEPAVCVNLIPAMRLGRDLASDEPISVRFASALPRIQSILTSWYPRLHTIKLHAPPGRAQPTSTTRGVGCFFSGGVDSFYSALEHADEIDTLVFIHGFDFPLDKPEFRRRASREMRAAADALGKRLIEVETDAREYLDPFGHWGLITHGAAMMSVAHLLAGALRKVYVPSGGPIGMEIAWGSHPCLDPLYGTESMEVVHDDDQFTRVHKTARVARSDVALRHLRVCWASQGETYNCGRCEKCLRTLMALRLAGALDRCPTFDEPLDLSRVASLRCVTTYAKRQFFQEVLAAARAAGDRDLVRAVRRPLALRHRARHWITKQCRHLLPERLKRGAMRVKPPRAGAR